jgi:dTDP-glucose 4,6-dehydratase (EC 4.2.1.46)
VFKFKTHKYFNSPKTTFEEGIEKTVKWYIENMAWVEKKLKYLKEYWDKVYSV